MLKDILDIIFALPNKEEMQNMTETERTELINKFSEESEEE